MKNKQQYWDDEKWWWEHHYHRILNKPINEPQPKKNDYDDWSANLYFQFYKDEDEKLPQQHINPSRLRCAFCEGYIDICFCKEREE